MVPNARGGREAVAQVIADHEIRFAVIDPIFGHINSRLISTFKDEQVRDNLMTPLTKIAHQNDCAILGVIHLNKRTEGTALLRVSGNLGGITGPVRSLLMLHRSPDDETQRILTHEKHNLTAKAKSLIYEVETIPLKIQGQRVLHPHLRYVGESDYAGEDLLDGQADTAAVAEAVEFLEAELSEGPRPSKELRAAARELGISTYAWTTAKKKLGIVPRKHTDGHWEMDLPVRITVRPVMEVES